jgi:hypothetical protein
LCLTRLGASATLSTFLPTICTVAPFYKAFAVAFPIPLVPPITKATFFSNSFITDIFQLSFNIAKIIAATPPKKSSCFNNPKRIDQKIFFFTVTFLILKRLIIKINT